MNKGRPCVHRCLRKARPWLIVGLLFGLGGYAVGLRAAADPSQPGPCAVASHVVYIDGESETQIHYPSAQQCGDGIAAPYPAIAFAHGFSMFGLTHGARDNAGNGEYLASWGYVAAIPVLPDDVEGRIDDMQEVLSYLEAETGRPASFLYQKVDTNRLATAGHSFGGATVLALSARDARIKAVVALDPVYHQGGPTPGEEPEIWDPDVEGPQIAVPACILGAPASNCNSEADYAEIYPFVGAMHKASFLIAGASHCDFADPGNPFCGFVCGASDPERTRLIQKYMTAWLNYYMYLNTDSYDFLYGTAADADIAAGLIERQVDTAPRGLTAIGIPEGIVLEWEPYEHPIVAGYNVYRRLAGQSYVDNPHAQVGRTRVYSDTGLAGGQVYSYTLCSCDPVGNLHQVSAEVSAVALEVEALEPSVYMPVIAKDAGTGTLQGSEKWHQP
jgi:dienelactone hydrolase